MPENTPKCFHPKTSDTGVLSSAVQTEGRFCISDQSNSGHKDQRGHEAPFGSFVSCSVLFMTDYCCCTQGELKHTFSNMWER